MKILVTGANGLLGHHVVMQLLERKYDVRIIVRSTKDICFDLNKVEVELGNFTESSVFRKAAIGCDAVIHIAAVTATNLLNYHDYVPVNLDANRIIIEVCNHLNINTILFVSTTNTIGYGTNDSCSDEKSPFQFPFTQSYYARTKLEAEKIYENAAIAPKSDSEIHIVIIHPAFMIGAYDVKPSSGKLMLMGYKKRLMLVPRGGKNFVATADVATAICNALTMGSNGEHYLATGINLSFKEFYEIQSRLGGYKQSIIELPDIVLKIAGKIGDMLQLIGIRTDLCSRNINQLLIREYYCNNKIVSSLRMPQTPIESAITNALDWFNLNSKK